VQLTSPPAGDHLIELFALADPCRRVAAARITAVVPFFGYGRSDKRHGRWVPIMAWMVADFLEVVGIDRVVTVDPHTAQIEGFFHVPVDSLTAVPTLCAALRGRLPVLSHPGVREVSVTESVGAHEENWPELGRVSIAPLASALERLAAGGPRGEIHSKSPLRAAGQAREEI
jgi:hypothetical protein